MKLNDVEDTGQKRDKVWNRFAALENLEAQVGIDGARDTIRENIKVSAKESSRLL
jgi:hypothetical protein